MSDATTLRARVDGASWSASLRKRTQRDFVDDGYNVWSGDDEEDGSDAEQESSHTEEEEVPRRRGSAKGTGALSLAYLRGDVIVFGGGSVAPSRA